MARVVTITDLSDTDGVGLADRVSISPAHDSLHGPWPLATSYQFVDREDEADFKAKDFADMRPTHLFITLVEMTVTPYSLTPLGGQSRPLTWPITVCIVIQLVVRYADVHSTLGADWYGKFYFATTLIEWALVTAAHQVFGFAPIASDGIFLVLFYLFCFLQGLLAFSSIVYNTKFVLASLMVYNGVCTLHLCLFVRASESPSDGSHAAPEPLVAPLAFGLLYFFESLITVVLVFSQLRARRFHHAELEYMHERLRREKERMGYELAIAQKAARSVAQSAAAYTSTWEGGEGSRKAARSVGSSGGMSSHMSELAGPMTTLREEKEAAEHAARQEHVLLECTAAPGSRELPTEKAEERQQRLWTTLAELGIRPKSATSAASDQALL